LDGSATADSWGPWDTAGVENDSNEISSCCEVLEGASGGESEASRSVSDGRPGSLLGGWGEGEAGRSNILLYLIPISVSLGISSSGDAEWSIEGKEESFRGEEAKDAICRARGGGEGLSCARIIRLASTDEGSTIKY
jgi:hypothetical protein